MNERMNEQEVIELMNEMNEIRKYQPQKYEQLLELLYLSVDLDANDMNKVVSFANSLYEKYI